MDRMAAGRMDATRRQSTDYFLSMPPFMPFFDMSSCFMPSLDMPSRLMLSLFMPVVPFFMLSEPMLPDLFMSDLFMLSDGGVVWAKAEPHMSVVIAAAAISFFMGISPIVNFATIG